MNLYLYFVLLVLGCGTSVDCLQCYECHDVLEPSNCNTTTSCSTKQACFVKANGPSASITFDMGCQDYQECSRTTAQPGVNLVGRNIRETGPIERRQIRANCHECCSGELCNQHLCTHSKPSACTDDPSFDCPKINTLFDVCADIHHAKLVCPDFCGLCDIVDGNWSSWNEWSSCRETCGNSTKSRLRTCTNPSPANGGLECIGDVSQSQTCTLADCPINGGWSMWSPWGECSSSCDAGIQRRDRSCSNPYPENCGDHCFGESRDDRLCMEKACTDGSWSSWGAWESCPVTCGGGLHKRLRNCTNPAPSAYGRYCIGNSEELELCNNVPCNDGGWSSWNAWGHCSSTDRPGVKLRQRQCNNPTPSPFGLQCQGAKEQSATCNDEVVAFNAYHITSISGSIAIFGHILLNEGNGYNSGNGHFTAPKDGVYSFNSQMCAYRSRYSIFQLVTKTNTSTNTLTKTENYDASDHTCTSVNAITGLKVNESVYVLLHSSYNTMNNIYQDSYRECSFTGIRVSN